MKKIIKYITHPKEILVYMMNKNFFFFLPDKLYLKFKFKLMMGYKLNLNAPKTFNEKLQWLKLYDRNPDYTKMVDKYEVREYIKEKIGEEYLIPLIGVYDKFDDINFDKLPNQFVIKCTHDSGGLVICRDKNTLDIKDAKKKIDKFMKRNYYKVHREWPYKNVKPRIIIEKYMEDTKAKELVDYKFMCFNGKPKLSFTCSERYNSGLKVTFFDFNWNKLPFERHYPSSNKKIAKPINYDLMLNFSKTLSNNIPFVRVDWYEINGKLYFGELTFYPGSGYEEFTPSKYDKIIGDFIKLDGEKNEK